MHIFTLESFSSYSMVTIRPPWLAINTNTKTEANEASCPQTEETSRLRSGRGPELGLGLGPGLGLRKGGPVLLKHGHHKGYKKQHV